MVGFNRRFAPFTQQLAKHFKDRTEPLFVHYRVNAGYIPLSHWVQDRQQGGGRIIGECCHFIDFITFLAGSAPIDVHANALPDLGKYCQDNVTITLTFADGSLGVIDYLANGDKSLPKEYAEVFCGGKVAILDDYRELIMIGNGKRKVKRSLLRQDKGHREEWEAFLSAIQNQGNPPIPYDQILGVSRACFMAVEALSKKP